MSAGFELDIESRTELGKGHSRRLRRQGKVPAVPLFAAVPFGMNAQQMNAWITSGGGLPQ